jgi:DNA-binding NarL/FixJ family response regulator
MAISVVLVDDQPLIRNGLRDLLEDAGMSVVGEAGNGREAIAVTLRVRPDIILMDLRMPILDGVGAVTEIRQHAEISTTPVLILTTFDGDDDVVRAVLAGADGFLSKSATQAAIIDAVTNVARGGAQMSSGATRALIRRIAIEAPAAVEPRLSALAESLTARERDVVVAAARGLDNQQIAAELYISPFTVKTHLNRAMLKLGARDRGQLVSVAYRSGLAND